MIIIKETYHFHLVLELYQGCLCSTSCYSLIIGLLGTSTSTSPEGPPTFPRLLPDQAVGVIHRAAHMEGPCMLLLPQHTPRPYTGNSLWPPVPAVALART